jgi:formyl-CoA transferase
MAGSAQSTFERICAALEVPGLVKDPRFSNNRVRLDNAKELDVELQAAIGRLDFDELMRRFLAIDAPVAPVNDIAEIFADPQFIARENIATVNDDELGGPVRMQNVVGKFSETPGEITSAGPRLGQHNREILIGRLGFTEAEVKAAGIALG